MVVCFSFSGAASDTRFSAAFKLPTADVLFFFFFFLSICSQDSAHSNINVRIIYDILNINSFLKL